MAGHAAIAALLMGLLDAITFILSSLRAFLGTFSLIRYLIYKGFDCPEFKIADNQHFNLSKESNFNHSLVFEPSETICPLCSAQLTIKTLVNNNASLFCVEGRIYVTVYTKSCACGATISTSLAEQLLQSFKTDVTASALQLFCKVFPMIWVLKLG